MEKQLLLRLAKAEKRIVDLYKKLLSGGVGGLQTLASVLVLGNKTGGTNIIVESTDAIELNNTSLLKKGSYDFGGDGGISRICSNQYEDMWQNGFRHVFDQSGFIRHSTNCFSVIPDETFDDTLRFGVDSLWTLDDGTTYKCLDNTIGAAVWVLYSSPVSSYKVYTALLTQTGVSNVINIPFEDVIPLTIGVTYEIINSDGADFTNVGAPNNNVGTLFVATGTTPNSWGDGNLNYDTGAPVVTVLENTIGNIWFTYKLSGVYKCESIDLFIQDKTYSTPYNFYEKNLLYNNCVRTEVIDISTIDILTVGIGSNNHDDGLVGTAFEIRVYNK
jgi:hypothetical protein